MPTPTKYVMSVKPGDHRVLIWQPAFDENTSYVKVSEEDALAVLAGRKTGSKVLREMLLKEQQEELNSEAESLASEPAEDGEAAAKAAEAARLKDEEDALKEEEVPDNVLISQISGFKVGAIRRFATAKFGLKFPIGTSKEQMTAMLTSKMSE